MYSLFTLEAYYIFIKAIEISNNNIIEPIHILNAIFITKNLITNLLNIKIKFNSYPIKKNILYNFNIKFSLISLNLISQLLKLNKIINTLDIINIIIFNNLKILKTMLNKITILNISYLRNIYINTPIYVLKNFSINSYNNIILGRKLEIDLVSKILIKKFINNPILLGEKGIGKFSIIKGVYLNYKLNIKYNNIKIFYLFDFKKFTDIITIESYNILQYLNTWLLINKNVVLILNKLDEYYNYNLELCSKLLNEFQNIIYKNNLQLLCSANNTSQFIKVLKDTLENMLLLESIIIKEPNSFDILKILQLKAIELSKFYNIKIPTSIINNLIDLTTKYIKQKVFPQKGIYILDKACSIYKNINNSNILNIINIKKAISIEINIPYNFIDNSLYKETKIRNLENLLKQLIFGQDLIIKKISNSIKRSLTGIKSPNKPLGSWLFCGPSGTGKTELVKVLTKILFGSESVLIRFDMSEFMEKHSVSKLIGSPPGYIGYGEKGQLTSAVDKTPYSIILFDEIEKAHSSISNIMLQILDDGRLTDSTGQIIKFSETLIIFTSNLGCPKDKTGFKIIRNISNRIEFILDEYKIHKAIKNYFKPEFINRLQDILIFQPLNENILISIINKFLDIFILQLKELKIPVKIIIEEKFKVFLSKLSMSPIYGARPLKRLLDELVADPIIEILLKLNLNIPFYCIYTLLPEKNIISYSIIPITNKFMQI